MYNKAISNAGKVLSFATGNQEIKPAKNNKIENILNEIIRDSMKHKMNSVFNEMIQVINKHKMNSVLNEMMVMSNKNKMDSVLNEMIEVINKHKMNSVLNEMMEVINKHKMNSVSNKQKMDSVIQEIKDNRLIIENKSLLNNTKIENPSLISILNGLHKIYNNKEYEKDNNNYYCIGIICILAFLTTYFIF